MEIELKPHLDSRTEQIARHILGVCDNEEAGVSISAIVAALSTVIVQIHRDAGCSINCAVGTANNASAKLYEGIVQHYQTFDISAPADPIKMN